MERLEGQRVERLEGRMLGRLEGLRVENLMEAYTFHNSFLIPSTHKFFVGDLRSPTTNKIYSPGIERMKCFAGRKRINVKYLGQQIQLLLFEGV